MFRVRESNADMHKVLIWIDGRLGDRDLSSFRHIINQYLSLEKQVVINLSNLNHAGWEIKKFFQEIKDLVELVDLPEHMITESIKTANASIFDE